MLNSGVPVPATKAQFMEVLSDIEVGQRSVREIMTQGCEQSVLVRSSVSNNMEMSMIRKVMMDIAVPQVLYVIVHFDGMKGRQ